jgi:hypothetical protein
MNIDTFLETNYTSLKFCTRCNIQKEYPLQFTTRHKVTCKDCYKIDKKKYKKIRQHNRRKFMIDYLKTHPCVDCGNSDIRVLEFDHLRDKKYTISRLMNISSYKSMEILKTEMDKCEVVCANCHRIRTQSRGNHYRHSAMVQEMCNA